MQHIDLSDSGRSGNGRAFDSVPVPDELPEGWRAVEADEAQTIVAERLEYEVFAEEGFCELSTDRRVKEFEPWRETSRFMVVTSPDENIHGAVRLMTGSYDDLPVGAFGRERSYPPDPVLEYASLAVPADRRRHGVAEWLYRSVWQQALRQRAGGLVAIGEQWLFGILNDTYGFGFEQLGPSRQYMGGECLPMGTAIADLIERLKRQPSFFRWVSSEIDLRDLSEPSVHNAVRDVRALPPG